MIYYSDDINDEGVEEVANYLVGTPFSLDEGFRAVLGCETDEVAPEALERLDEMVFQCNTCGYWYELDDLANDGGDCLDCEKDAEEEI